MRRDAAKVGTDGQNRETRLVPYPSDSISRMASRKSRWKWVGPSCDQRSFFSLKTDSLTRSVIPTSWNRRTCAGRRCAKCKPTPRSVYAFESSSMIWMALTVSKHVYGWQDSIRRVNVFDLTSADVDPISTTAHIAHVQNHSLG